ncbi:hypothetical protein [Parasitella parasitica]|uniref:Uncharacterized protein n=1 Tax=Parasitella parasitica TaxID=35722 RepID=A0A0B7NEJ7_9FUNG|nr:hypothetical protein [Parasitella parasitica]
MDEPNQPFRKSTLESNNSSSEQDPSRATSTDNFDGSLLAQCNLVSSFTANGSIGFLVTTSFGEFIRQNLSRQQLNAQAVDDILSQLLANTATNKLYRKNQLRFLDWAIWHKVSLSGFSSSDVVNFLEDMRQAPHNLQASTLKTLPRTIASRSSTSRVKLLQQKLAFLIAMTAFLHPSDLVRISFASCIILDSGRLRIEVVSPKKTRRKRRIVKPFTLHPHAEDCELCPIQCFKAIRDYPALQARPWDANLFVRSNLITQSLSASIVSTWLHLNFISLCTSEPGVSIRSLASSRALDLGISQENIVALRN